MLENVYFCTRGLWPAFKCGPFFYVETYHSSTQARAKIIFGICTLQGSTAKKQLMYKNSNTCLIRPLVKISPNCSLVSTWTMEIPGRHIPLGNHTDSKWRCTPHLRKYAVQTATVSRVCNLGYSHLSYSGASSIINHLHTSIITTTILISQSIK